MSHFPLLKIPLPNEIYLLHKNPAEYAIQPSSNAILRNKTSHEMSKKAKKMQQLLPAPLSPVKKSPVGNFLSLLGY